MRRHVLLVLVGLGFGAAHAQELGMTWPEAAEFLRRERLTAEACARVVKRFTPKYPETDLAAAELEYETARADFDGVITGLQVALIEDEEAPSLETVETRLAAGTEARRAFCDRAEALLPPEEPAKGGIGAVIAGTASQVIESGLTFLEFSLKRDDSRRDSLRSALDEAKWPPFAEIATGS